MVGEEFIQRWVRRLRHEVPDAVAVFLGGSHVRGDAGPYSDVDFDVLVAEGPRDQWPLWFDLDGQRLVGVDVWVRDVARWLASQEESQDWAFGLASAEPLKLCWVADDSWRARLERPWLTHPAGEPELGHFVSDLGKVANAQCRGDELALRLAAQDLARSCPALLQPVNPTRGSPAATPRCSPPSRPRSRPAGTATTCWSAWGYRTGRPPPGRSTPPRAAWRPASSTCWPRTPAPSPRSSPRSSRPP